MSWRILGAVLLGVLLALPLVLLLAFASFAPGTPQPIEPVQRPEVLPMLTPTERQTVLTYGRQCEGDEDCDPRLRCFFSMVTQDSYCVDSRCQTDLHCPEGFACQTYASASGRDLLKACSLVGERKEGEVCAKFTRDLHLGCEQGLRCDERCGRPCPLDNPAGCPAGFFCKDTPTGALCQPTCEEGTCPEGQQCISVGPRVSVCAKVHGQNCQRTPCTEDQHCHVTDDPLSPGEVWMNCLQPCGTPDEDPPCPEDAVCLLYRCRKKCTPRDASSCGAGYVCKQRGDDLWLCTADRPSQNTP